jgi:hypothetical protein
MYIITILSAPIKTNSREIILLMLNTIKYFTSKTNEHDIWLYSVYLRCLLKRMMTMGCRLNCFVRSLVVRGYILRMRRWEYDETEMKITNCV